MTSESEPKFLGRFEHLWAALRRYQAGRGGAWLVLTAGLLLTLMAWADYRLELAREVRIAGFAAAVLPVFAVLWCAVIAPLRWWTKPRTAVEIEGKFPQLGQRIRTIVQYAGLPDEVIVSQGVAPSLVGALGDETEAAIEPLPLDRVVPWRRLAGLAALAIAPLAMTGLLALRDPEWRIALQRIALIERPYTTLTVMPGDILVEQGDDLPIAVEVAGRPRARVVLETRPLGQTQAEWKSIRLNAPATGPASRREAKLEKVKEPVGYRVVAGPERSGSYKVDVRYPLTIQAFDVRLTPPAYTGLKPETVKGGDIRAVEGTAARFLLTFDTLPDVVFLELTDLTVKTPQGQAPPAPTVLPLRREGESFVADLDLVADRSYRIVARRDDGRMLPKNRNRIDVYEDRAPRVAFDEPDEALEVHPIAEVRQRVRVGDDFGLTKAGIVFRFNDGEESTLVLRDFAASAGEKPTTSTSLEETLLMETLAASPTDSVTYYAFAEDNYPGGTHRTETDLRFIDIRAFKREYKLGEPGVPGDPRQSTTLEELIARQRFNLNRTYRMAKHKPGDRTSADEPLKIAGFEEVLLNLTKEFTEGIEGIAGEPVEELRRAQEGMLAALDALDNGRNVEAPPAMAEALKHLVSARRELATLILENPMLAAFLRNFDRRQAQKIRKPKAKDQEAEEIAADLEELAGDEDFVYATIAASLEGVSQGRNKGRQTGESADPKASEDSKKSEDEKQAAEPKSKDAAKGQQGQTGEGSKGQTGKGQQGSKPEAEGQGEDGPGNPGEFDRRALAEKQEEIADEARALEERLKRLEVASDLARARMARAAEKAERASGALARGNTREAGEEARAGAGMLRELARQVKGEIAREAADELAMARDLAQELAEREADLADDMNESQSSGPDGSQPGQDGETPGKGQGRKPGRSRGGPGGRGGLSDAERIEKLVEGSRTLEEWLRQVERRGEGQAADTVREILENGAVAEIVERNERLGELRVGGKPVEAEREAREVAGKLERLGQSLEILHRGLVAPQLAALVEFDRRVAALTAKLATLKTDARITAWHREAAELIRDLENAGIEGADALAAALRDGGWTGAGGGGWHWTENGDHRAAPGGYTAALQTITSRIKDRVQDMILKDMASARDEATPPMYRAMVERYYEVLSGGGGQR